ncbi:hypothetical protein ZOD2009_09715 [Haladaptatus paucihalophilus DX253]|uniref:Uncharacterized protein n=1 Tax=Haladaptatus paucihalophilus DX253 TaxID=797209 RepID=E7QT43_HALPU|nr:hypothetical protein [Haladaptatus paucihalophilus]EFW92324.1 hypothetical protein ZOD2009_09715 [Haladaptatus paucihalophilus DX253]
MTEHNLSLAAKVEEGFRQVCGSLLKQAYDAVRDASEYDVSWDEDEFTREIVYHMDMINEADFEYPLRVTWDEKGKTRSNMESDDHPNTAQRVDITLDRVRCSGTTEYSIECKRVSVDESALVRKYWKNGVRRFVDAEYADRYSFGAMAAYVLQGDLDANAKELQKRSDNYEKRMHLIQQWEFQYEQSGMKVYLTGHSRDGVEDIELDHHLLDFT